MRYLICFLILITSLSPLGAKSYYRQAPDKKLNRYLTEGVVIGGHSGKGFTLLDIRRYFSKKKGIERIVLDIGDHRGQPLKNELGFFHVSLDKNPNRIVIDLAQSAATQMNDTKLQQKFKDSPFIKSAGVTVDVVDVATTLRLSTRKPVAMEVFKLVSKDKNSRIVIDLRDAE